MARIRTIKPEFWRHEELSALPEPVHMLAAALLNYSDDEGYFNANPGLIKGECFPIREPSVSIPDGLKQLAKIGYVRLGSAKDGKRYGQVVTFADHQRVNRPTPSKIKAMDIVWDDAVSAHTQISESSPPERKGKEGNREEERNGDNGAGAPDLKSLLADFDAWYARYPRKVKPEKAKAAYLKARKSVDAETLLAGLEAYIRTKPSYADWQHPTSWLNDKRWLDEPDSTPAAPAKTSEAAPDPLANEKLAAKDVLEGRAYYRQTVPLTAYRSAIAKGMFTAEQAKAAGVSL